MKIENVKGYISTNYPKMNEVSANKLKASIPKKWARLGITSFIFSMFFSNKIYALDPSEITGDSIVTSGIMAPRSPIFAYGEMACLVISIVAAITFLINLILIVRLKIKARKEQKEMKISTKLKISIIISIVIVILSTIGRYILSNMR